MKNQVLIKKSLYFLAIGLLAHSVIFRIKGKYPGSRRKDISLDGINSARAILAVYKAPFYWNTGNVLTAGAITGSIGWLFMHDEEISNWFVHKSDTAIKVLKDFGWYYGSPENHFAINGGFYLYGLFFNNPEVRKTGLLLISSTAATGILQTIFKKVIGRARPIRGEGKASFSPFSNENSYYSFPSGHSILSFTTAYALSTQLQHPVYKSIPLLFGFIAPVSRLWAGAHWITDVVTSFCISVPVVNKVINYLDEGNSK